MKRSVLWILLSYSVLGLTGIPMGAQGTGPERETLVVEPGNDFRAALEKGVRLKAVGQPITAKLLERGERLEPEALLGFRPLQLR